MTFDQSTCVLDLLRERGEEGITAMDALEHCGSMRLAGRIFDLRAEGHVIDMERVPTPSGKRIGRYRLKPKPKGPLTLGLV
jgi:hypothetical protein